MSAKNFIKTIYSAGRIFTGSSRVSPTIFARISVSASCRLRHFSTTPVTFGVTAALYKTDKPTFKMHSEKAVIEFPNLKIIVIPATADNFMYLVVDKESLQAAAVDPVDPDAILEVVRKENVTLTQIWTTHHHWDHAGGNEKMVQLYSKENANKLEVYGGDSRIGALTRKVGQNDKINLGSLVINCLFTPCHTTGHICYFVETKDSNMQKPAVFTGDTLFIAGCGRFFEGTAEQMHEALISKLGNLPEETLVFCGHEYTVANLKFGLHVEKNNETSKEKLRWAENQRSSKTPTVPSTIGEEKLINPFMRCVLPEVQKSVGAKDAISCMAVLRESKNNFKG